ncbi:MAG: cyanophycin synthetase [Gammaproteobacteria bacterium]|nr:cyanophycin synthetase [Gammaproteobacteria bacterium]
MTRHDLKILELVILRGPNRWSYKPALEALVDIGTLEECPSNSLPGFVARLLDWLPGLHQHECSYEVPGGFVRRLQEGTWVGHILEHVTLELQSRIGHPAGFGRARGAGATGVYHVVVRITQEDLTRACLLKARELILAAIHAEPFDVDGALRGLRKLAQSKALGPSTACIVEAARTARIPVAPLAHGNLVLLGQSARQRRIWTAETDSTSAIAESIAKDKDLAKELLGYCGLPVPEGQIVRTLAEAWRAAEELGLPVVLKPAEGSRGEGVSLALLSQPEIAAAFERAQQVQSAVIIERYVEGIEHRLLVVGERVVAVTRAIEFTVTGNGHDAVGALVTRTLGGRESDRWAAEALLDYPTVRRALNSQTLDANSVPAAGRVVGLHRHAKLGEDVLAHVHPDTLALALLAARIVGLDIAGIDIVARDIGQPLAAQQGAIIEVNAGPSLPTHLRQNGGTGNTAGDAVVRHLFPAGEDGRIPLVGITGCADTTSVAQLLGYLLYLHGRSVGVACAAGIFLGQRCIQQGDGANWSAGQRVLINRTVDAAVIETSPTSLLREGLPYDRCLVGVLTSIEAPTEVIPFGVQDAGQMAHVLRTQIDVVLAHGVAVLNADDAAVLALAPYSEGEVLLYSRSQATSAIQAALLKGARAVYVDGDALVFAQHNNAERRLLAPCVNAADCLPAAAAAWALGIPFDLIIGAIVGYPVALLDQRTATF